MTAQILFGTGVLALCALIHIGCVAWSIPVFVKIARRLPRESWPRLRVVVLLTFAIVVLVGAHTVQVWIWAVVLLMITDLSAMSTSFYFATVTYTTLGYGDIVLGAEARILATFCAVTGLLTFGISTAFLMGVLVRVMPDAFSER